MTTFLSKSGPTRAFLAQNAHILLNSGIISGLCLLMTKLLQYESEECMWKKGQSIFFDLFLVADTQLYKRLCPSVCWSIGPLVRYARDVTLAVKTRKTCIHGAAVDFVCGWVCWKGVGGVVGVSLGLDAPAQPSATILWPHVTCLVCLSTTRFFFATYFLPLLSLKDEKFHVQYSYIHSGHSK